MEFLRIFIGLILLTHQVIFFLGLSRVKKLMTFANVLQCIFPALIVLSSLYFQSWELLILAFLVERLWIIFELVIKSISIKRSLDPFFFLQILGFVAGLLIVITHLNWIFAWVYGAFWVASFIHWKKKVQHISN